MSGKIKSRKLSGVPFDKPSEYEAPHAELSRKAAAEGFVLLKNEDGVLPLKAGEAVALYGAGASETVKGGTGSGDVNERYSVSIYEGMKNAGFVIADEDWINGFEQCCEQAKQVRRQTVIEKVKNGSPFFDAYASTPFCMPVGPKVTKTAADTAIYVLSRIAGEGADRTAEKGDYFLSGDEYEMLSEICRLYKKVIVLVNTGGVVDLSFLDEFRNIKALMIISQPGMEGGNAVADVLCGKITPSGKLTATWAYRYDDYPSSASFNKNEVDERYEDGIYVGYRYFDTFGVKARYGFGAGLSYTEFKLSADEVTAAADGTVTVSATVKNIGGFCGKEVVQVYVSLPRGSLEKEYRRLCAFAKTDTLEPNSSQKLTMKFSAMDMASYDENRSAWVAEAGVYGIFIGNSLENAFPVASLHLKNEKILMKTKRICPLQKELKTISCPAEKSEKRMAELCETLKKLPEYEYDLSVLPTKVIDYSDNEKEDDEAVKIASGLSAEKLTSLVIGQPSVNHDGSLGDSGASVPGSAGETSSAALGDGVANIVLADGPAGLRLNKFYYVKDGKPLSMPLEASMENGFFFDGSADNENAEKYFQYCTAIPVGTLLAQTWNAPLVKKVGEMIAEEMEFFGVTLWLAPGMNIQRNPLCGRNFEYYSEDPLLSGKIAAAMTNGVQSRKGCGTTVKHFACNNRENNRLHSDSIITERALREIYLRGFETAIRESKPLSLMTSYNLINGVHSANNHDLCTDAARREFGFDGFIMTDWTTTCHGDDCTAAGCIRAGNDMVMPGKDSDFTSIRAALEDGSLTVEQLRDCAARIIRVILRSSLYED